MRSIERGGMQETSRIEEQDIDGVFCEMKKGNWLEIVRSFCYFLIVCLWLQKKLKQQTLKATAGITDFSCWGILEGWLWLKDS